MIRVIFVAFMLLVPSVSGAADFDALLGAYDVMPTQPELDAIPEVRDQLERAARDSTRTLYFKHRAITLMSFYPDTRTRAFLEALLHDSDPQIRRMAVYVLGRVFGSGADGVFVARIAALIEQDPGVVAEWAVRSLRWVHHEDALRVLSNVAQGADERLASIAAGALRESVMVVPAQ